jgi:hypothetical protein
MTRWIPLLLALLAACSGVNRGRRAAGQLEKLQGGAFLRYEATAMSVVDEGETPASANEVAMAGARLHGFVGRNASVAYHVGLDLAIGGTFSLPGREPGAPREAGFAYDVALFPTGIVMRGGRTSFFGFSAGIGASGATGAIDDGMTLPLEAFGELGGSGRLRLLARARATKVLFAESRQSAARSFPFTDEFEGTLALRIGHHYEDFGFPSGNGGFIGLAYKEMATARMVGVTFGYAIDLATPRRWRDKAMQERQQREDAEERKRNRRRRKRR